MLALAHDLAVMRSDRGYFCLPEVDLGIPFTPGMNALIRARLPIATAHEAMTTGRRYGGEEAHDAGIVAGVGAEDEILDIAVARAQERATKAGPTMGAIKARLYGEAIEALDRKLIPAASVSASLSRRSSSMRCLRSSARVRSRRGIVSPALVIG